MLTRIFCALTATILAASHTEAACCYFSAKNADILQPSQKVFLTWDPANKMETFTVQPKFEGNALDFGMVIPTPTQPKLHEMPRDFFKHLAVYTILKKREQARSKLLDRYYPPLRDSQIGGQSGRRSKTTVVVLECGVVGSLDYKIITASRADDLFQWLKDHKYRYAGDEATLNHYVQKKWLFTVMKIDTMQMKRNKDGTFAGEVTPTRFQFTTDSLVYPLKITQISVKERTEALFYVQAPSKMDLQGEMSFQYTWVPMLQSSRGCTPGGLPGRGLEWLRAIEKQIPNFLQVDRGFQPGQRPQADRKGHIVTTMEWARKLTADDIKMLRGGAPYSERLPDLDEGLTDAEVRQRANAAWIILRDRLEKSRNAHPIGYLVREAPADDVRALQHLVGHLKQGLFITKFRKIFARDEMNDDLVLVPARLGDVDDFTEYEEILPTSPP